MTMKKKMSWELEPGVGSAGRLVELAGPPRNMQITRPTRSPLLVSSDSPPGRCLIQQISLTSIILYGPHYLSGYAFIIRIGERRLD